MKHEEEFSLAVHMQQRFLAELPRGKRGFRALWFTAERTGHARACQGADAGAGRQRARRIWHKRGARARLHKGLRLAVSLQDYEATLPELLDAFYYFKNASGEQLADDS